MTFRYEIRNRPVCDLVLACYRGELLDLEPLREALNHLARMQSGGSLERLRLVGTDESGLIDDTKTMIWKIGEKNG